MPADPFVTLPPDDTPPTNAPRQQEQLRHQHPSSAPASAAPAAAATTASAATAPAGAAAGAAPLPPPPRRVPLLLHLTELDLSGAGSRSPTLAQVPVAIERLQVRAAVVVVAATWTRGGRRGRGGGKAGALGGSGMGLVAMAAAPNLRYLRLDAVGSAAYFRGLELGPPPAAPGPGFPRLRVCELGLSRATSAQDLTPVQRRGRSLELLRRTVGGSPGLRCLDVSGAMGLLDQADLQAAAMVALSANLHSVASQAQRALQHMSSAAAAAGAAAGVAAGAVEEDEEEEEEEEQGEGMREARWAAAVADAVLRAAEVALLRASGAAAAGAAAGGVGGGVGGGGGGGAGGGGSGDDEGNGANLLAEAMQSISNAAAAADAAAAGFVRRGGGGGGGGGGPGRGGARGMPATALNVRNPGEEDCRPRLCCSLRYSLRTALTSPPPPLRELRASRSVLASDAGLHALAQLLGRTLQVLDVSESTHVTDAGLLHVAYGCTALTSLDVSATGITDWGVRRLVALAGPPAPAGGGAGRGGVVGAAAAGAGAMEAEVQACEGKQAGAAAAGGGGGGGASGVKEGGGAGRRAPRRRRPGVIDLVSDSGGSDADEEDAYAGGGAPWEAELGGAAAGGGSGGVGCRGLRYLDISKCRGVDRATRHAAAEGLAELRQHLGLWAA
ncbi:hypothetical protein HYH02_009643 [Chlamydomonas schloesseri]|uniref:Uncharacterized protein n=1 Tax=Chlamydomonas schloesseri TaxID=2026947 RepID=A0A835TND9_9CHLO|nr:hypothetical protein HYH02_009643 [Chlamydomonas schloesseri]|eukprot:KAG2442155.1 hypothetical protein HYH02_009643 [Chlamydomonas schloesseri]